MEHSASVSYDVPSVNKRVSRRIIFIVICRSVWLYWQHVACTLGQTQALFIREKWFCHLANGSSFPTNVTETRNLWKKRTSLYLQSL